MRKIFIIGGTGNISRGTLDYLLTRGDEVALYTRNAAEKRFIEINERRRAFPSPAVEIIEDKIIRDWKERLRDW